MFWIIGDGELRKDLEARLNASNLNHKFWGIQSHDVLPRLLNCSDLVIIPSINEGLPMVSLEALACGANVICSDAGGTKEAAGADFTVELGDNFLEQFVSKINDLLITPRRQECHIISSWEDVANKESKYYQQILSD